MHLGGVLADGSKQSRFYSPLIDCGLWRKADSERKSYRINRLAKTIGNELGDEDNAAVLATSSVRPSE